MITYLKVALRIYKWVTILFLTAYLIYIVYVDFVFFKNNFSQHEFGKALMQQFYYLIVYFLILSIYYWVLSLIVIVVYLVINKIRTRKIS
jgi:hypothetical protein